MSDFKVTSTGSGPGDWYVERYGDRTTSPTEIELWNRAQRAGDERRKRLIADPCAWEGLTIIKGETR